ncbi:uncharacterized protein EV154DRAFT_522526 [Mucor mucedo]|uniref:uncharacterized protein n=1 Tax=Mucor mucedo TaxID=29922 RepID=UPI00221F3665|nr:uncharacterized protein EV154DRAFT_522526 [Mucor mucedo]KAI7883826.1 hypothetical protein EV154DRAFT_522526 [Mucor mucedo]
MARETGGAVPHKGCNSSSCCSPAKLWRTMQTLIKENDKRGLIHFFKDARLEHIVRVALTSRITNDASMLPASQQHKIVKLSHPKSSLYLGKSFSDLNSLQLALISAEEQTVLLFLSLLRSHATQDELKIFVNHIYGQGNTSLHLAVFLRRYAVVKVLIELGSKLHHSNARHKIPVDCCYDGDQQMIALLNPPPPTLADPAPPAPPVPAAVNANANADAVSVVSTTCDADAAAAADNVLETIEQVVMPKEGEENPIVVVMDTVIAKDTPVQTVVNPLIEDMTLWVASIMKHVNKIDFNLIIQQIIQEKQYMDAHYVSLPQLKKPPDIPSCLLLAY